MTSTTEMTQEDAFELLGCGARGYARAQMRRFVRLLPDRIARIRKREMAKRDADRGYVDTRGPVFLTEHKYEQE